MSICMKNKLQMGVTKQGGGSLHGPLATAYLDTSNETSESNVTSMRKSNLKMVASSLSKTRITFSEVINFVKSATFLA